MPEILLPKTKDKPETDLIKATFDLLYLDFIALPRPCDVVTSIKILNVWFRGKCGYDEVQARAMTREWVQRGYVAYQPIGRIKILVQEAPKA